MSEAGFLLFDAWSQQSPKYDPEDTRRRWDSLASPRVGWHQLEAEANKHAGAAFPKGVHDFEAIVGDSGTDGLQGDGPGTAYEQLAEKVLRDWAYLEPRREWVRLYDCATLQVPAFNDSAAGRALATAHHREELARWRALGDAKPAAKPKPRTAHELLCDRALTVQGMGWSAAQPKIFSHTTWSNSQIVNSYIPPDRPFADLTVTDGDVAPYLKLVRHVLMHDERQVTFMLDWMSYIAQHPGRKIHFAPVMLSRVHGSGKDTLLKVLAHGVVGEHNYAAIPAASVDDQFNEHWVCKEVVAVNELPSYRKKDLNDSIKELVAGTAGALMVNPKGQARYQVPNSQKWVFTTNKPDAIAIEDTDRRFIVLQCAEEILPAELRDEVYEFYDWDPETRTGSRRGLYLAGEWLRQRKISAGFNPAFCDLVTDAKIEMRDLSKPPFEAWIEDAVRGEYGPFRTDLVVLEDVLDALPGHLQNRAYPPTSQRMAAVLRGLGGERVGERTRLTGVKGPRRIWACRRAAMYRDLDTPALREELERQQAGAAAEALKETFGGR